MKKSKQALFQSVISLLLCFSMLVGTTFAWFTDGVSSGNNLIAAGNLDVDLEYMDKNGQWQKVTEATEVLDKDALWEPGHTEVAYLRISNAGDLALKYALGINIVSEIGSTNAAGEAFKLSDHIRFGVVESESETTYADRMAARNALSETKLINAGYTSQYSLYPETGRDVRYATLVVYMPEDVGNVANYATGANPPEIQLGIELVATQEVLESDSFGTDYDTNAEMPGFSFPENVFGENASAGVSKNDENKITESVTIQGTTTNAVIPVGVQLDENVDKLTLEVTSMTESQANITLGDNDAVRSLNVHVEGVSKDNTMPMEITIKEAAAKGLNSTSIKLYHVENGVTVEMSAVDAFTAHNQFKYDPATGDITLYMATFSEVACVVDTLNPWTGGVNYDWYTDKSAPYYIANAEQLAAFGAIVGGMDGQTRDSFEGKTVKLISNINLGDKDNANENLIFHPIGYSYVNGDSTVKSFEGIFDGQGHIIANFYQNTWEIKGDYDGTYYKDAMGLFGYVVNGTVKNLTVDHFSSDGEFTPTGVIAAYAVNSTFENIAITNCNPRVYNTGNGGIIGIAGKTNGNGQITLENITVDNSNKITALWGSWDVACGGLVGMFRGNADGGSEKIHFENCHVAAQIDVYNDVCANYQYYAYRYAGMIIGSVRHNTTNDDGKTIPNMTGISASGCTVNYGDWNDYYYCEFVKNSLASYTHDHQFSRVSKDEIIFDENGNIVGCKHNHKDYNGDGVEDTEVINGETVYVEDKTAVYLPFHQLFTGYSWGVTSVGLEQYGGIVIKDLGVEEDKEHNTSAEKFETNFNGDFLYRVGTQNEVTAGTLFSEIKELSNPVVDSGVVISVTSLHDDGINMGTFTPDTKNWENGKIKFNQTGIVKVTIQDYDYCKPTELIVEVIDATNLTSAEGTTTGGTFVLVSDVNASSYVNYWNATVYGNGFTYSLKGAPTTYNSKQGHGILIAQNTIFDNVKIVGDIYTGYGAYKDNDYYNTAVDVVSDTTFRNCYIANCAAPIKARGNVTIIDSTLYGGSVANLLLVSGTATLENVTTANYDDGRTVVGMGIVVHSDATESAKLVLNGKLTQYNFINESKVPTDSYAQELHKAMFDSSCAKYHFGTSPNRSVNTGIISLTDKFNRADITDNANTGYDGVSISRASINGYVYTQPNTSGSVNNNYSEDNFSGNQGDYLPTPNFNLGDQAVTGEDRYLKGDINGIEARYVKGEAAFTLDIDKLMTVEKYGISLPVSAVCTDAQGKDYTGVVTLSAAGTYTLKFTATDNLIYDKAGNLTGESKERIYTVSITLVVAEPAIKDAEITVNKTALDGSYSGLSDQTASFNPLSAITITDAEGTVNLTTNIASTNITYASSSSAYAGATTITVTYNDGRILTITLGKPTLNSPGSSKAITYANDGTIKSAGAVAKKSATGGTWTVTSYSFKGTNGKTVANNTVVTFTFPDKSCVTGDTLVMLADGTQKRIDEVTYSDELLVWDFFKGEYATVPSSIIFYHGDDNFDVLSLYFEDGTTVKTINVHGFFDIESNTFEFIEAGNVESYIGHRFAKVDGDSYKAVKLIGYDIAEEYTGCYSIQSAMHNNFITEGMFSLTIPAYEGWFDYFEIGDDMKYDEAKKQADIEKYGLYTYEEFADYVTYEQFIAFNGPYLKVLVGRGVVTFEDILNLIASYVPN